MAEINVRTSVTEADHIIKGEKKFIFRDLSIRVGYDDTLTFTAYKYKKPTRHPIESKKYKVTYISTEAPIEKGFKVIGFESKMQ